LFTDIGMSEKETEKAALLDLLARACKMPVEEILALLAVTPPPEKPTPIERPYVPRKFGEY
jgi:hypothetical protein